jgi:hypothetical protein
MKLAEKGVIEKGSVDVCKKELHSLPLK